MSRPPSLSRVAAVVTAALLLAACSSDGELTVEDARSRMSPMFAGVGAVYLDISNTTDQDDRLIGASVDEDVAASVEIHETFATGGMGADDGDGTGDAHGDGAGGAHGDGMEAGAEPSPEGFAMMGMREVEGLDIPAGGTVELVPGGYHLMLMGLATDLEVDEEFELVLEFEHAGTRTVTVTVRHDL